MTAFVSFHGHQLATVQKDSAVYVAMKPIVEAIGLQWEGQFKRIKRHAVLSTCMSMMDIQLPGDQQRRQTVTLPLNMLNGWLFGVDAGRVKPEIRETLLMYQRECFQVLADYWHKRSQPAEPVNLMFRRFMLTHDADGRASMKEVPEGKYVLTAQEFVDAVGKPSDMRLTSDQYATLARKCLDQLIYRLDQQEKRCGFKK